MQLGGQERPVLGRLRDVWKVPVGSEGSGWAWECAGWTSDSASSKMAERMVAAGDAGFCFTVGVNVWLYR